MIKNLTEAEVRTALRQELKANPRIQQLLAAAAESFQISLLKKLYLTNDVTSLLWDKSRAEGVDIFIKKILTEDSPQRQSQDERE